MVGRRRPGSTARLPFSPELNDDFLVRRTSSTSVEQARERSYHRALLLSKDKDTGETG